MEAYLVKSVFGSVKNIVSLFETRKMGAEQSYSSNLSKHVSRYVPFEQKRVSRRSSYSVHDKHLKISKSETNLRRSSSEDHKYELPRIPDYKRFNSQIHVSDNQYPNNQNEEKDVHYIDVDSEKNFIDTQLPNNYVASNCVLSESEMDPESEIQDNQNPLEAHYRKKSNSGNDRFNQEDNLTNNFNDEDLQRASFVADEFNQIEENLKQVHEHIQDMQKHHDVHSNEQNSDSIECINIYLTHDDNNYDSELIDDDEFGQRILGNHDNVDFVEAFNRLGDELVITTASIERKSVCIDDMPENLISIKLEDCDSLEQSFSDNNSDTALQVDTECNVSHEDQTDTIAYKKRLSMVNLDMTPNSDEECSNAHYMQLRNGLSKDFDKAVRAETIYDHRQNPRIEKVTNINTTQYTTSSSTEIPHKYLVTQESVGGELKKKKDYIIEELVSTEKAYLKQLEMVVCNYMPLFRSDKLPVFLRGSRQIFGNIKKIYSKAQKFYRALKKCGTDHDEIGKTFIIFEEMFELYPLYSKNKPTADYFLMGQLRELILVKEKMLNDRLGLASHLLTPVQRLGKYILLLEQIQKEIIKSENVASGNLHKAIAIVRKQMSRGNDFIAIDSIKDCQVNLEEKAGSFLMREKFDIIKPKKYEGMLFLFENILVFTTVDVKNSELFTYKDSISLDELGLVTFEDLPLSFHLKRFTSKSARDYQEFVIEAKKTKDKKIWTEEIEKRLWEQLVKCKEQQKSSHHKRYSTVEGASKVKSKKVEYRSLPGERKEKRKSIFYDDL